MAGAQEPADRVHTAQADAWQAEGRLRASHGGGVLELDGVRLMASGLPFPKWNNGDVIDVERFPLDAVRAWYAGRAGGAGVPWGVRVPAGAAFGYGRHLFRKRCMALAPPDFVEPGKAEVTIRAATWADADAVARIDALAFDDSVEACRLWNTPHIDAAGFSVALAELDGVPVGLATSIRTDDRAGPCVGIFGIGVLEHARRRGVGAALTAWLVARAIDGGAALAHLNPDSDAAARLYGRLGFRETAGLDVYVEL